MTKEATTLISIMVNRLSSSTHLYRETVEGCYDLYVDHSDVEKPEESKDFIIDKVLDVLNYSTI
jgi:hypothetical protein